MERNSASENLSPGELTPEIITLELSDILEILLCFLIYVLLNNNSIFRLLFPGVNSPEDKIIIFS